VELSRQRARFFWMGILLLLAFCCLGYRLVQIQVVQHAEFRLLANRSHALMIPLKGHRGDILDHQGEVLARSLPAKMICADPSLLGDHYAVMAQVLAPLLRTNVGFLTESLRPRFRTNETGGIMVDRFGRPQTNQYVALKRRVPDEEWKAIQARLHAETFGLPERAELSMKLLRKAIYPAAEEDEIRIYPNGTMAAPILGFTDTDGRGLEGLEAFLNDSLKGVNGYIETERSRRGGELRQFREVVIAPQHGRNVYLTLDSRLQLMVEEELVRTRKEFQARGACAVLVQPRTGRILAMASVPTYDPNKPPLGPDDAPLRRNRAISHTFEPGSTFKIVAATAALNEGVLDLGDMLDCGEKGVWRQTFGRERVMLRDAHAMKERWASVERVIAESSNIGTFQMALKLGRDRYADYLYRFGFDQRSGIRLPVEERGQLRPVKAWTMTDFSRVAMGYTVSITPLQLAMAMSALGNDGRLMRPQIIDRIVATDGTVLAQPAPEVVRTVCRPEVAAKVRQALRQVVEDGTGSLVKMDRYSVAGKTGTAKIAPYPQGRYFASFVGFFPSESPELCMAVVVEDPNPRIAYYGGRVAGPAFRRIAERAADYLGIQPDLPRSDEEKSLARTGAMTVMGRQP